MLTALIGIFLASALAAFLAGMGALCMATWREALRERRPGASLVLMMPLLALVFYTAAFTLEGLALYLLIRGAR